MEKKKVRKRLSLDLKLEDWEALRRRAEAEGVGVRTILRRGLLRELGRPVPARPRVPEELRRAYRELAGQIARLGSNVNQIARKLNQGRELDREAFEVLENVEKALAILAVRWTPSRALEELKGGDGDAQVSTQVSTEAQELEK